MRWAWCGANRAGRSTMGGSWSGLSRTTRAASKPRTNGKVLEREGGGGKDGTGSTSGMLDMLQKMVPAVEGRNVPTAGKQVRRRSNETRKDAVDVANERKNDP